MVLWILAYGALIGVTGGLFWYMKTSKRFQLVGANLVNIQDVKDGDIVQIRGRVELMDTLEAPLTKRPCAGFQLFVERRGTGIQVRSQPMSAPRPLWEVVHKTAHWEDDPDGQVVGTGYRGSERAKRLRITGAGGAPVLVHDH